MTGTVTAPLDAEELAWLKSVGGSVPTNGPARKSLFLWLWSTNTGLCKTCGALEGRCSDVTCIRSRVTNKLGLTKDWDR